MNRSFGGRSIACARIREIAPGGTVSILDIATGSGDIALAMAQSLSRAGITSRIVGLDVNEAILDEAARYCGDRVALVAGDARSLPFSAASFDVVTCTLALHHFLPNDARLVLAEMWRVARSATLVVDLARSYPALLGTWLVTRAVARHAMTRHDGPLSVRRAYTPAEAMALAHSAGWEGPVARHHLPFRFSLSGQKSHEYL